MWSNSDQFYNLRLISLIGSSDVLSRRQWCTDNPSASDRLYITLDSKLSKSQFIKSPSIICPGTLLLKIKTATSLPNSL